METVAPPPLPFFQSPQRSPHLAELRIDPSHSAVAFSAPCAAGKRRCLLPASSTRKKMLLELHPFGPSPPRSPPRSSSSATEPPPALSRAGSPAASEFSFQLATAAGGSGGRGRGGGSIFAFSENLSFLASPGRPATPTGSGVRGLSFLASPGRPATPTGSTASGGLAFLQASMKQPTTTGPTENGGFVFPASPEQPLTPTGSNANGSLRFLASPRHPLTPTGSCTSGGGAFLSYETLLSPKECHGIGAVASMRSPGPAYGHTSSPGFAAAKKLAPTGGAVSPPPSPSFVFSASPVHKSGGGNGSNKRPRRHLRVATATRRRCLSQWEDEEQEQQRVTPPPQKVAKRVAGEASRSSAMSGSTRGPCCIFFTLPAKASNQEAKKASSEASGCATSPARPSSVEKAIEQDQEVEVSSVEREVRASPAACTGAEVVVRVTCKCGVHKEFSFAHSS